MLKPEIYGIEAAVVLVEPPFDCVEPLVDQIEPMPYRVAKVEQRF